MTISALPTPPSRADAPADFIAKANAFMAALPQFVAQANALESAAVGKGFRNKIINGDFDIWQRGTSISCPAGSTYTADRWFVYSGGATVTVSQGAGDGEAQYSLSIAGAAGSTGVNVIQRFESVDTYALAGKSVTIKARIFATSAFTPSYALYSADGKDNFSTTMIRHSGALQACAAGWNDVSVTISALNSTAAQNGIQLSFLMLSTLAGDVKKITRVQLEEGAVATPFERRPYGLEMTLCRRYYRASSFYVPATTAQNLGAINMRATPTISGGGAGFVSTGTTADTLIAYQTTGAVQTLTLSAEL